MTAEDRTTRARGISTSTQSPEEIQSLRRAAMEDFVVDFSTGTLTRRTPRSGVTVGAPAGRINGRGYVQVGLHGRYYLAHRLIWLLFYGTLPETIDHINGIRHDNRIANLRDVSLQENLKNKVRYSNNSSGTTGVRWVKADQCWRAEIRDNGKLINLGRFKALHDAISAREKAEQDLGFHKNHGLTSASRVSATPDRAHLTYFMGGVA